jgi:hypothetical protein
MQDFASRYRKKWLGLTGRKRRQNQDSQPYDLNRTGRFGITTGDGSHFLLDGPPKGRSCEK